MHRIPNLLCLTLLISLSCSTPPEKADPAPLVAVSNMLHPPFSSWGESRRAVGIEVDLIAQVASRLGREVVWIERPFTELLPALESGEADFAASTIGVTPERAQLVAFSTPYHRTTIVALVREGEKEPRTLEELRGKKIATERGTTAVQAGREALSPATFLTEREGDLTWAEMLALGQVDAVVLDRSHAEKFMSDAGERFHIIDEALAEERFAIAVALDAAELRALLDEAIARRGRRSR